MYLADTPARTDSTTLAKAWMLVLGISIGVGFAVGHLAERRGRRR
jgi:hypothetical protein